MSLLQTAIMLATSGIIKDIDIIDVREHWEQYKLRE